jgi:hypothetical protein
MEMAATISLRRSSWWFVVRLDDASAACAYQNIAIVLPNRLCLDSSPACTLARLAFRGILWCWAPQAEYMQHAACSTPRSCVRVTTLTLHVETLTRCSFSDTQCSWRSLRALPAQLLLSRANASENLRNVVLHMSWPPSCPGQSGQRRRSILGACKASSAPPL